MEIRGMIRDRKVIVGNIEVDVPRRITLLRTFNDMTQIELANKLGVTPSCVCSWEKGRSTPRPDMIFRMCKIFDVPVHEFVEGKYACYGMR